MKEDIIDISKKATPRKVAFYTLGCKVNQYETNGMIQHFLDKGYEIVDFDEYANIYTNDKKGKR